MLTKLELNDGLVINTDDILTTSRHNALEPPLTADGLVIDEDKYVYLQECLIGHGMMSNESRNASWIKTVEALHRDIDEYRHWLKCMEGVAPDDPEHKYAVAMKNGEIYYITKKEYDMFNNLQSHSISDEIYDKVKEVFGLKYIPVDKELRITNSETIDTDDNSIQLKLTFELKDVGDD